MFFKDIFKHSGFFVCSEPLQPSSAVRGRVATCHGNRGFITKDSSPRTLLLAKTEITFPVSRTSPPPHYPPLHDMTGGEKNTQTAVLTLLRFRRHFADTWWNIKPRLSSVLVVCGFFFLPGVVSLCREKVNMPPPPHPPRSTGSYHCTTLRDGFIRRGFLAVVRCFLPAFSGIEMKARFVGWILIFKTLILSWRRGIYW